MLPLHREVLDAYLSQCGGRVETPDRMRSVNDTCSVEYDGTIIEKVRGESEPRVVARWSIDLLGRISIRLLQATSPAQKEKRPADTPTVGGAFVLAD